MPKNVIPKKDGIIYLTDDVKNYSLDKLWELSVFFKSWLITFSWTYIIFVKMLIWIVNEHG